MLDRRHPRHLIAALVLLVGQWLLFAHAIDHALSGTPEQASCDLCAVAHAAAPSPAPATLPPLRADALPLAQRATPLTPTDAQLRLPPACGPPSRLA